MGSCLQLVAGACYSHPLLSNNEQQPQTTFIALQDKIKDKLGLLELRAGLLLKMPGRSGNAEANFRYRPGPLFRTGSLSHTSSQLARH